MTSTIIIQMAIAVPNTDTQVMIRVLTQVIEGLKEVDVVSYFKVINFVM